MAEGHICLRDAKLGYIISGERVATYDRRYKWRNVGVKSPNMGKHATPPTLRKNIAKIPWHRERHMTNMSIGIAEDSPNYYRFHALFNII